MYEGDAFSLGFNLSWTLGAVALQDHRTADRSALIRALDDWGETVLRDIGDHPALAAMAAGRHYFDWIERRDNEGYWAAISGVGVGDTTVPAAQIGGWFDLFAAGTFTLHEALARGRAGSFHRLIIGPWDHSALPLGTGAGETDFGAAAAFDLANAQRVWFDWLLRGESEPAWRAAQVFLTGWNHWVQWDVWPPPSRVVSWYLQSNGRLDAAPPAESEVRFIADADDPTPTVGGRLCCAPYKLRPGQLDQRSRATRPDVVVFASPPMSHDLLVAGPVRAEIWATSSAVEGDVFVTLVDVAPDGRAVNLAEGVARRRFEAGGATQFDIDLGHAGHAFQAGHRFRVDLAAHSFPRFDRFPAHGVTNRSILLGPSFPSRILLPIVD